MSHLVTNSKDWFSRFAAHIGNLIILCLTLRFLITIIIVFSAHKYFIDFFKKMWHVTYQNNP